MTRSARPSGRRGRATRSSINDARPASLPALANRITACRRCDRLVTWCASVARDKRAAYAADDYWGRPVAGFGDPRARLVVVGLAPGAHGANRTGRVFTGDRSGEWLYRALHRAGFANQPTSAARDDGLALRDCWVTVCVRCAPPDNKPTPAERDACRPFLVDELALLRRARVARLPRRLRLGRRPARARRAARRPRRSPSSRTPPRPPSAGYTLLGSYHPSQQNTFTGKLTEPMLDAVFTRARALVAAA